MPWPVAILLAADLLALAGYAVYLYRKA